MNGQLEQVGALERDRVGGIGVRRLENPAAGALLVAVLLADAGADRKPELDEVPLQRGEHVAVALAKIAAPGVDVRLVGEREFQLLRRQLWRKRFRVVGEELVDDGRRRRAGSRQNGGAKREVFVSSKLSHTKHRS